MWQYLTFTDLKALLINKEVEKLYLNLVFIISEWNIKNV